MNAAPGEKRCTCSSLIHRNNHNNHDVPRERKIIGKGGCPKCHGIGMVRRCTKCGGAGMMPGSTICDRCNGHGVIAGTPVQWSTVKD